jgi:hypothetical protein
MNCTIIFITFIFAVLVDSAPTPASTTTSIKPSSRIDNIEVQREVQFESFFKQVNEEQFEETAMDMKKILQAQDELFKDFMNLVLGGSGSTTSDDDSQNSRKRRSTRMDTMIQNSTKRRYMKASKDMICKQRCFWKKIYYLCRYGIRIDEPCYC